MEYSIKDKVIFVTGGTSGIGRATVIACLREGAKVAFTGRRDEEAAQLKEYLDVHGCCETQMKAEKCGYNTDDLLFLHNDIKDPEAFKNAVDETIKKW